MTYDVSPAKEKATWTVGISFSSSNVLYSPVYFNPAGTCHPPPSHSVIVSLFCLPLLGPSVRLSLVINRARRPPSAT